MYHYIGKDAPIHDAPGKVTGRTPYCGDMQSYGMLHLKLLRSPVAHAQITAIDTTRAEALPGVVKVLTFANTTPYHYDRGRVQSREASCDQETLFTDHVRFVGDRIAGVVATSPEIAQEACTLIRYEYQELPAVLDIASALAGKVQLHKADNTVETPALQVGDFAAVTAEREFRTAAQIQRVTHVAMEPHAALAEYRPDTQKLTVWTPCQSVFGIRNTLSQIFGLPLSHIRVIKTTMGGSFGCKQETILEPLAAAAAIAVQGTVKLVFNREEVIANTMLKHPIDVTVQSKFTQAGRCLGLDVEMVLDAGAYQTISPSYARAIREKLGKVYDVANFHYHGRSVCTNTPVSGSYRSWSSSESVYALESHLNTVADELGIDPVELRLQNIHQPLSVNRLTGQHQGNVRLADCLHTGAQAFDWQAKRQACAEQPGGRYRRGVGMALGSHTSGFYPKQSDMAALILKMQDDASVLVDVCLHDHGCGTITALNRIIAEELSIPAERIMMGEADTDHDLYDYGCYGSRTIYVTGRAAQLAAQQMKVKLAEVAASLLNVRPTHISCENGYAYDRNHPEQRLPYQDLVIYALDNLEQTMTVVIEHPSDLNPGVGAAHFAEVSVDTYTGLVRVGRYVAVHDIGLAINPEICRAQLGGAIQQGIGIALGEIVKLNAQGSLVNKGLKNYGMLNSYDMPQIETIFIEEGEQGGPFGAKSFGEVAIVPVTPAIVAAVNHALGTRLAALPLNPTAILAALYEEGKICN